MEIHWRNTQKPVRFFFLDARAFIGFLVCLVHARIWTLMLALALAAVFWVFERMGLTFASAVRAIRVWFVGSVRPANSRRAFRRWTDYQGH